MSNEKAMQKKYYLRARMKTQPRYNTYSALLNTDDTYLATAIFHVFQSAVKFGQFGKIF